MRKRFIIPPSQDVAFILEGSRERRVSHEFILVGLGFALGNVSPIPDSVSLEPRSQKKAIGSIADTWIDRNLLNSK